VSKHHDSNGGQELQKDVGTVSLFAPAYGNLGSNIYFALGLVAAYALGLTPLAFIAAGILFVLTVLTYTEGATMFPEAGGAANFARHGLNDAVSFIGGWALSLDYLITIAISVFFAPHYLSVFWQPLRSNPWDIITGVAIIVILCTLNVLGIRQASAVNIFMAFADLAIQVLLVGLGVVLLFNLNVLVSNIAWDALPTQGNVIYGFTLAMVAYAGIETISNMAEEVNDPGRRIPRAAGGLVAALLGVYLGMTVISMLAMPVYETGGSYTTDLAGEYASDPILGIVDNLAIGFLVEPLRIVIGILAATILITAANAGIIGISRIQYSLATHREVPRILGRISSRTLMPVVAIVVFGALAALLVIPGNGELLADMYAYGVLLAFTVAHLSIIALRWGRPELERPFRVPLALRVGGHEVPILPVLALVGTLFAWVMILIYHTEARYVGTAWMIIGITGYVVYRRRQGLSLTAAPEEEVEEAPAVEVPEVEYADILVPVTGSRISEEMIVTAAKLIPDSEREEKPIIHALDVIEVPRNLPPPRNLNLEEALPEKCQQAQEALDEARQIGEEYGVEVDGYTVGARHVGQAIVEEAQRLGVEVVMFGIPRKRSLRERLFGGTVDYVLKNCPCKIHTVVEEPRVA
jgi:APA family basic amino acid/polyamine antiporter